MQWESKIAELEALVSARDEGTVSEEEFLRRKTELLGQPTGAQYHEHTETGGRAMGDQAAVLRDQMKYFGAVASNQLGRLLVALAMDQSKGKGPILFLELAEKRIEQSSKWRMWCGIIAILILIGALAGGEGISDRLRGLIAPAILVGACYVLTRWRNIWVELKTAIGESIQHDPKMRDSYERDKAAYEEAIRLYNSQTPSIAEAPASRGMEAAAFAVGAVVGYKAVASHERERREERNRQSRENDEARRRAERLQRLNNDAKNLAFYLGTTKNPDERRRMEAKLRQIEIEIQSFR